MTELIHREMEELFYMFIGGMAVMAVFQAFQHLIARRKLSGRLYGFSYLLSWICAGYLFCQFLYQGSYGKLSWYTLPVFASGCILWKKYFYDIISLYTNARKQNGDENNDEEENKRAGQSF